MNPFKSLRTLTSQVRTFNRPARLFLLATILDGIVFSAWSLFFNFYILERGFPRDFLGLLNAMPSISALLFGIPIGMLSDRLGRKRSMLIGVGASITCMGLEVTLEDPNLILLMAFLAGMAGMLYFLSHAPFMMKVSDPENRTLLFSLSFGLVTLSGAVGSLFAGQLPAFFGGLLEVPARSAPAYQAVLLFSVSLSFLTLIPLSLIREPKTVESEEEKDRRKPSLWKVVTQAETLKLALPNLLIGLGAAILIPYMNVFFADKFSLPDRQLGFLFSLSALLTGVGSVLAPRLSTGLGGKIRAVVFTQAASLTFLMLVGFSPFLWLVSISFLMRGTLMNMAVPLYHAFAMEQIREREQGTVNSVIELAWQVGWAVGPYVSGVVQQRYGFAPLFITTGILYLGSIGITWAFFRNRETEVRELNAIEDSTFVAAETATD